MKMKIIEKDKRFEINLLFNDGRAIDVEIALHRAYQSNDWSLKKVESTFEHEAYELKDNGNYLTTVHFTRGWEPPTRVTLENKPFGTEEYWESAKDSTLEVAREFLKECAHRFLLSDRALDKALIELRPKSIA